MLIETYGDYKLETYDPVTVTLPDFSLSNEDVDAEMMRIVERHSKIVTIEPHDVRADDMLLITIKTSEGTAPFPGLTRENVDVQLGVGELPEEVELALLGHAVGDKVEARFIYKDYSEVTSKRESPADGGCGVADSGEAKRIELVSQVEILAQRKHAIPELTDSWVEKNIALSDTVESFRSRTTARLIRERRHAFANEVEYAVVEEMGKRLVGEPPENVVNNVHKQMLREFDRFLTQYDLDLASYLAIRGIDDITFNETVRSDASKRVSQDIALAAWAKHAGLVVDDSDIDFLFGEPTPERTFEARIEAEQSGQIDTFRELALRAKVARTLTSNAIFVKPDGTVDKAFADEMQEKYRKREMVRKHATAEPMLAPPIVATA